MEAESGCRIMIRGKGSMRDKAQVRYNDIYCLLTQTGGNDDGSNWMGASNRASSCCD
jgi:hypothetical protein